MILRPAPLPRIDSLRRSSLLDSKYVEREVDASSTQTPVDQRLSDSRDREAARSKVELALGKINPRYARASGQVKPAPDAQHAAAA